MNIYKYRIITVSASAHLIAILQPRTKYARGSPNGLSPTHLMHVPRDSPTSRNLLCMLPAVTRPSIIPHSPTARSARVFVFSINLKSGFRPNGKPLYQTIQNRIFGYRKRPNSRKAKPVFSIPIYQPSIRVCVLQRNIGGNIFIEIIRTSDRCGRGRVKSLSGYT